MIILKQPIKFEWGKGNNLKNYIKHDVLNSECEEVFFDAKKVIAKDILHSATEGRYIILGQTKRQKVLFIVFTVRKKKIKIISARNINKKEKKLYDKTIKNQKIQKRR